MLLLRPSPPCGTTSAPPASMSLDCLLYRSNLLGADLRVTNFGGGNTSAKIEMPDPLTLSAGHRAVGQGFGRRSRIDEA